MTAPSPPPPPPPTTPPPTQLKAVDITAENWRPFGQLVFPGHNAAPYRPDASDAELDLSAGTPRLYLMHLPYRGREFDRITYHARVTQCLGGLQPLSPWYLVVSPPTLSTERPPRTAADLTAFRIPHGVFVKLHKGTWHAGPLFDSESATFYNLELSDTNETDHNTHYFSDAGGEAGPSAFVVVD